MVPRYGINHWLLTGILFALLLLASHFAHRLGHHWAAHADDGLRAQVGTIETAVIGTMALLLGFTFSLSGSRFDSHRFAVVDEANAIGTAYLRCDLIAEPARSELRRLLRQYLDTRLELAQAGNDEARVDAVDAETTPLQRQIWTRATEVARQDPHAITTSLLLSSINEIIDMHPKRMLALETRVPKTILILLALAALGAVSLVAFALGLLERRHLPATVFLSALVSLTVFTILDLDRPRLGAIQVSQKAMLMLQQKLER